MATVGIVRLMIKKTEKFRSFRLLNYKIRLDTVSRYTYSSGEENKKTPITYSTSNAAKYTITENLFSDPVSTQSNINKYIIIASFITFFVYFCIIRRENDIDLMMADVPQHQSEYAQLINLKIKLSQCRAHHIPAPHLEKKIEELSSILGLYK